MIVTRKRPELATARSTLGGRVAVVMTMGALHAGHVALLRAARSGADRLVTTIFVNPLQFGPGEDFDRYPRGLAADLELCEAERVDLVFAPPTEEVYPDGGPVVRVDPGQLGTILEGAARPGHFAGVLTVVLKLLHLTQPNVAYFGEKDYQQLTLIRAMVRDLDLSAEIVGVPIVRAADGLALSSRNRHLTPEQRRAAPALSRALGAGAAAAEAGQSGDAVLGAARAVLAATPEVALDYLELTDPLLEPRPVRGPARLMVAARLGTTRLIDNQPVELI